MADFFACPECGQELEVEGSSPGREVQCEECSTCVEVPFLPRNNDWKRSRRSTHWSLWLESKVLRGAIVFACVTLVILTTTRMIGGRVRTDKERILTELQSSAEEAEASRRYDVALREFEGALAQARTIESEGSGRLAELKDHRDRVSLREAECRLNRVESLDPDHAVGEVLTIAERARHDLALVPLAEKIEILLGASRRRQAEADLKIARQSLESGKDAEAFTVAERLHDRSEHIADPEGKKFQDEARAILESAVLHSGVALPPVTGRFVVGSAEVYTTILEKQRAESLRLRGYLPQSRKSRWSLLWDEKALLRATVHVVESQEGYYLQSKNRITQINGTFELIQAGEVIWKSQAMAQTRMPLPDLPAYLAGHLATAGKRDLETERRLHDDAVAQFLERGVRNLRGVPTRQATAPLP